MLITATVNVPPGLSERRPIHLQLARRHDTALLANIPQPHFRDRKSTRLNSSHSQTSYAGFCLKKKNIVEPIRTLVALSGKPKRAAVTALIDPPPAATVETLTPAKVRGATFIPNQTASADRLDA